MGVSLRQEKTVDNKYYLKDTIVLLLRQDFLGPVREIKEIELLYLTTTLCIFEVWRIKVLLITSESWSMSAWWRFNTRPFVSPAERHCG